MSELKDAFLAGAWSTPYMSEALRYITNPRRGVWFIGGFVYRTIAAVLYRRVLAVSDIDIIVEALDVVCPPRSGWTVTKTSYGSPRYRKDNLQIDFIPIDTIVSIKRRGLEPTIENFITGVPLTIQSVAFDIRNGLLLEAGCQTAMRGKVVCVNDIEQAHYEATKKKKTVNQIIREKAESLGFTPVYVDD